MAPAAGLAIRDHDLLVDGPPSGAHGLAAPPAFVHLPACDLRLRTGSPGTDAGDPAVAPATDFHGTGRRGRPRIGAFEVRGTTAPAG